jgi:hypothetical protein
VLESEACRVLLIINTDPENDSHLIELMRDVSPARLVRNYQYLWAVGELHQAKTFSESLCTSITFSSVPHFLTLVF